jgi:NADH-quinone oxidoreductase subunit C
MAPDALNALPADSVVETLDSLGEATIVIDPGRIVEVCRALKEQGFERLASVTAVDRFPCEPRFEVVYHLHSIGRNRRLRLKCRVVTAEAEIDSVTGVWRSADWYEREVYDLFGITFRGHPGLRRILMPEDWDGHPLRKDYPVHGHRYSYKDE